jgi:hypothetical protein
MPASSRKFVPALSSAVVWFVIFPVLLSVSTLIFEQDESRNIPIVREAISGEKSENIEVCLFFMSFFSYYCFTG